MERENENLIKRIQQSVTAGKIFHGYIIEGKAEKTAEFAEYFMKAVLCETGTGMPCGSCRSCRKIDAGNSEDIIRTVRTKASVTVKDIQALISETMKKSYTGRRKFLVVNEADLMTAEAQNKLLKTLEEPPENITIILLSENTELLFQTIRSRCQLIKLFSPGIEKGTGLDENFRLKAAETAADIISGKPAYMLFKKIANFTSSKQNAYDFISVAETFYRDIMTAPFDPEGTMMINKDHAGEIHRLGRYLSIEQCITAIGCAEQAVKDLTRKVSPGHAIKYMILDIQEKINDNSNRRQI